MKINAAWKYIMLGIGIALTAAVTFSILWFKTRPECDVLRGETVVRWKDQYWPCYHWWGIRCRRLHRTYKVTVNEGIPLLNENGDVVPMAGGKIRDWRVYDATAWNEIGNHPPRSYRYLNYESIAENEYVVVVETRYWLFHNVEENLRLCIQKP